MKRRVLASMIAVVVAILVAGLLGAYRGPWTDVPGPTVEDVSADSVSRIRADPDVPSLVLPADEPPRLESVTTVHLDENQFEMWFQDGDDRYALCVGDESSACDGSVADVVREEVVDGLRVRVARVSLLAASPTEAAAAGSSLPEEDAALQFWRTVRLVREVPTWLSAVAPATTPPGVPTE